MAVPARMASIEAARGVAALAVLLMHAAHLMRVDQFSGHVALGGLFDFGYVGVDFFFVLSGFIISHVHQPDVGQARQLPLYLWRRAVRIYPIYWSILTLNVLSTVGGRWALGKPAGIAFGPVDVAATLFLLPVAEPRFLGVSWSLQYELMFYAMFAVLICQRRLGLAVMAAWLALVLLRLAVPDTPAAAGLFDAHSLQFLLGAALGWAVRQPGFPRLPAASLWGAGLLFAGATVFERSGFQAPHGPLGRVALGLASACVLAALVARERRPGAAAATPRALAWLGSVSYTVYLGHITVLNLYFMGLLKLGLYHRLPEAVVFASAVAVALACTAAIGQLVELPLTRRLRHPPWGRRAALGPLSVGAAVGAAVGVPARAAS